MAEFEERIKPLNVSEKLPEKNMACLVAVGEFNLKVCQSVVNRTRQKVKNSKGEKQWNAQ